MRLTKGSYYVLEQDTLSSTQCWFNPGNVPTLLKICWMRCKASTHVSKTFDFNRKHNVVTDITMMLRLHVLFLYVVQ